MWNVIVVHNSSFNAICDGFDSYQRAFEYVSEIKSEDIVSVEIYKVD